LNHCALVSSSVLRTLWDYNPDWLLGYSGLIGLIGDIVKVTLLLVKNSFSSISLAGFVKTRRD